MSIAKKIIFGDNLEVTDQGNGIIRVDGSQSVRYLDLGLIQITDLQRDGLKTLYQPTVPGEWFILTYGNDDQVISDVDNDIRIGQGLVEGGGELLVLVPEAAIGSGFGSDLWTGETTVDNITVSTSRSGTRLPTNDPVQIGIEAIRLIDKSVQSWLPNHAFEQGDLVIGNGDWFQAQTSGTSGGTEPIWPIGTYPDGPGFGTVIDNDLEWLDVGTLAAEGAVHFYALVLTPTIYTP